MPAPLAVLIDLEKKGLDPTKPHTTGKDGKLLDKKVDKQPQMVSVKKEKPKVEEEVKVESVDVDLDDLDGDKKDNKLKES